MNKYILILVIFFVFKLNTFSKETVKIEMAETSVQTEDTTEVIKIENYEDAKEAYTLALFYKEKAIASHSFNEEAKLNLEKARDILTEIIKFIPTKETYFELAETYEALYEIPSALEVYEELLNNINPYDEEVLFRVGESYLLFNIDFDKAEYYLKTSLSIEENSNNTLILLGYLFYEKRDYINASKYFSKVDVSRGGKENYLDYYNFYYAVSEFNQGNFKNTLESLDKLNIKKISQIEGYQAIFMKSKSYQALEEYKKAYEYIKSDEAIEVVTENFYFEAFLSALSQEYNSELFDKIVDNYDTPKIIRIAYTANTESPQSAINMIETDIDRSNFDLDVIQYYYLLVDKYGNEEQKKQAEIDILQFYFENRIYESIEKHIDKLIKKYPLETEYKNIYLKLSKNYINIGNNKNESKKNLEKYISIATEDEIKSNFDLIFYLITNLEDYELGINILDKIPNESTYTYYALFYSKLKNFEKAKEYIEKSYENLNYNEYYLVLLFSAISNTKDKDLIVKYGEEFSESESFNLINNYAWTLINQDIDYEKGINYIKNVLKYKPLNGVYMDTLAWGYYKTEQYEKALNILLEAALYIPKENEAEAYLHIADVYLKMGDIEKALLNYRYSKTFDYKSDDYDEDYVNSQIEKLKTQLLRTKI